MYSKILLCLALALSVQADDLSLEYADEFQGEGRFLESVFNNTSIDLNSILAALLIGILALVTIGPNFLGGGNSGSYGYNRNGYEYDYQDAGYGYQNQNEFYKRHGYFETATKMDQLERAFKKYQVEEEECRMYVACEASQTNRLEENGPLAKAVNDIFSGLKPEERAKFGFRHEGYAQAFDFGLSELHAGKVDSCEPLRNKCFTKHTNKQF